MTGVAFAQEKAFYQRLSGWNNLMFYASLRTPSAAAAKRTVQGLVDELQLAEFIHERADRYSSGMVQQVALARALLGEPALLILDEPTRSLDTAAMARLWDALERRPALSLMIASHRPSDLERCTLRIDLS
jgi:ABC-2 type transport system ATP-binding protein